MLLPSRRSKLFGAGVDWRRYNQDIVTRRDGLLLPACRTFDALLAQPPLAIALNDDQLTAIARAESQRVLAATILGPTQEKTRNEDFALAAVIIDKNNVSHAFAAVADGVTSKTFWAERASRLACFIALQVAINYVDGHTEYSVGDIEEVRHALAEQLRRALQLDRRLLCAEAAIPADWDPASFKKFSGNEAYWYNTTLLMSLISPKGGMLLWSGDGAIYIRKEFEHGGFEITSPLRSTDDLSVDNVVSLGGPILFSGGRLDMACMEALTITLCTDGTDRTLQRNGDRTMFFDNCDSPTVAADLEVLATLPKHEIDNYSAAIARWPIPVAPAAVSRAGVDELLWSLPPAADAAAQGDSQWSTHRTSLTMRQDNPGKANPLGQRVQRLV